MCAYIRGKSKNGKNFKIAVEDKHKYFNFGEQTISIFKTDTTLTDAYNTGAGYCIGSSSTYTNIANFSLYNLSNVVQITQGTGEDQRVGNKVFMKFLNLTYEIHFDGNTFINNLPQGTINDSFYRFRVMVVKFDDDSAVINRAYIRDWFRDTYTYFRSVNVTGGLQLPYQSVHTQRMRESTEHTGKFEILYNKSFKMGKKKVTKISSIPISINQNLNFDSNNKPTDDNFKNIVFIVIGPVNNYMDMDCISQDKTLHFSTDYITPFAVNGVLKYEWYDM